MWTNPLEEQEDQSGSVHGMNGSCMPYYRGANGSRSRSPQRRQFCASMVLADSHCERNVPPRPGSLTGCIPSFAKSEVAHLPPHIKCRFPSEPADEMNREALRKHCHSVIRSVRAADPQRWYIGVCASPKFRWHMGHYEDYIGMYLLVTSRSAELTRSLEEELITFYLATRLSKLQNIDPNAAGTMRGSPHFLYVTYDIPGPLRRRPRR